ncbi:hypothetical protein BKA64DRAFT_678677 [Cadophora sp. MPI-SDFR-AT-0126]|nr:hypothetical protein BKA64DRAFT_678677 [Leotiomycetes sp. MPI-SDFR-AT-0126]
MDLNQDQSIDTSDMIYPSIEFQVPGSQLPTETSRDISRSEFRSMAVSIDPPMSFRDRHHFLNDTYDRHPDPERISAKELGYISRQVGLCMEEVHAWFEDESQRRTKLLAKFQSQGTIEPRPCSPESMSSHAPSQWSFPATTGRSELSHLVAPYYSQTQSIFSGPSSPGTVTGDYLQVPTRVRRGRPPRTDSKSPPQAKRQKISCQYPCFDCGKAFPADRWSEHVKRVHFPDYIWECPKTNERTGKPCSSNPFFRTDNFTTHLRGEHRCEEPEMSRLKTTCKFEVVGFFHKICGICSIDLKTRDESIEHTKEHLREICRRKIPPTDLGLSEWKERCGGKHKLKRGVHYQLEKGHQQHDTDVPGKDSDGDMDDNNYEDQSRPGSDQSDYSSFQGGDVYSFGGFNYGQDFDYAPYRGPGSLQDPGPQYSDVRSPELSHSSNRPSSPGVASYPYSPSSYLSRNPYLALCTSNDTIYDSEEGKEKGRCPIHECGKVFKDLKAHMLTHQNKRPEKCPIQTCDYHTKGFARKYDKNRHTLTHYKGTMVCGFCPGSGSAAEKSFNRADVFKRHLTSVHGVEQTPPNSRKKSTAGVKANSQKKLSGYAPDATGKCSTCSANFSDAQDFYEHLDDCVLRIVQQEEPSEAINAARLAEVPADPAVDEALLRNALPTTTSDVSHTTEYDKDEDEDEYEDFDDEHDSDFRLSSRSRESRKNSVSAANGVQKSRGLTHSKGGVALNGGRRKRKDHPTSWGDSTSQMKMKKRVLNVFDGPRRLWKDDMMLNSDYEVRVKLADEKAYVTDLDVQTMRRADEFHASSTAEKGPWITDDLTGMNLEQLMEVRQE